MKKSYIPILLAILIITSAISVVTIGSLQRQLISVRNEMSNLNYSVNSQLGAVYSNVEEMLSREADLLELAQYEIGALDAESLTVPVTFSLTPKVITAETSVSLDIGGEIFPLQKDGISFSGTIVCPLFGDIDPLILIDDGGIIKTATDERLVVWSLRHSVFPQIYPHLVGSSQHKNGVYKYDKLLRISGIDSTAPREDEPQVTFVAMELVIKVDGDEVRRDVLPIERLYAELPATLSGCYEGFAIKMDLPLADRQACTTILVATDSLGFTHHYPIEHFVGGRGSQAEAWFGDPQIYSPDGALIFDYS